jgi:hypothetical protein
MSTGRHLSEGEVFDLIQADRGDAVGLGWQGGAVASPDEAMMEAEEAGPDRHEERRVAMMRIFDYVLTDWAKRPDPADVGRRLLAMAKFCGHAAVEDWSLAEIATASGETKASVSARVKRLCNAAIERAGGVAQARWQQGVEQRAKSAEVQRGNKNRAKTNNSTKP